MGTNQNAVYRLENPNYGKPTITTLRKVAAVFDVALVVRFVPFSQLVDWVSGTPFVDHGLTPSALSVPSFRAELEAGGFEEYATLGSYERTSIEEGLARKILGEDKAQQQTESAIPVAERVSREREQQAPTTSVIPVATPNIGGLQRHAAFGGSTG